MKIVYFCVYLCSPACICLYWCMFFCECLCVCVCLTRQNEGLVSDRVTGNYEPVELTSGIWIPVLMIGQQALTLNWWNDWTLSVWVIVFFSGRLSLIDADRNMNILILWVHSQLYTIMYFLQTSISPVLLVPISGQPSQAIALYMLVPQSLSLYGLNPRSTYPLQLSSNIISVWGYKSVELNSSSW